MIPTRFSLPLVLVGLFCIAVSSPAQEPARADNRAGYVGDAACISCHHDLSDTYRHTGHRLTSHLPTATSVLGSFRERENVLTIVDGADAAEPTLRFVMESRKDGFYETAETEWDSHVHKRSERIDLITGSGTRGQTYLYWRGDRLFELPVSYWTDGHKWINSPGYINGTADFSRVVNPACLECHSTYIRALSTDPNTNRYDKSTLVPGLSCETCHGPGGEHVRIKGAHQSGSGVPAESHILNPAKFSRDRKIDLCAECHNGIQRTPLAPAFSYVPGQPLGNYYKQLARADVEHPDVHGDQVGLLQRSKCYVSSKTMTCSTCHDVHAAEKPAETYSAKCLGCHKWQSCKLSAKLGHSIVNDCINCHMPIEQTNVIVSETANNVVHARMRNHWIKIYPEAQTSSKQ
jgi:Cytochrome c554 and c-prime